MICVSDSPTPGRTGTISVCGSTTLISVNTSQGQQRTAALSLKLAEIRLVRGKEIHDTPVLLLDDVLSELDGSRQNYLLQSIHSIQTLITCTGLDEFVENHFEANSVFQVVEGSVFHKETGGI